GPLTASRHPAFRPLLAFVVDDERRLPHRNRYVQDRQPSMAADGKRASLGLEFLVLFVDTVDGQISEDGYPSGSAAFDAAKMKRGHSRRGPLLSTNSRVLL